MEQAIEPIRILIADDHPIFRFGMRTLLTAMPDMTVVGETVTGEEAIQLTETLLPDLVLMDINMPGMNGIEATARIRAQQPHTAILIVTMLDDDSVFAAMRAGARGYLLKGAEPAETLRAIRAVASGEAIFSPGVAQRVMDYFAHAPVAPANPAALSDLSEREREVLTLIAQGLVQSLNMVDNWISLCNPFSGSFFIMVQSRQVTFPRRRLYPSTSARTFIGLSTG